jgi:cytochrome P450
MCFSKADVIQQTTLPQQANVIQQGNLLLEGSGRPAFASSPRRILLDLRTCPARGWPRQSQTKSPQQTQDLPLAPRLRRFAFEVIATVVLGLRGQNLEALFLDFEIWSRGLFAVPLAIPGTAFAQALAARARLLQRLQGLLAEARQAAARGEPWAAAGLDLLAGGLDEAGLPLSEADLVEQLLLLLFAGYETTASTLNCMMLALLQQPQLLAWLGEELDQLAWPPAADQVAAAYNPTRAPRLDAVVQEVMRYTPPVGGFFRRTTAEVVLDGVLVPAERVVQVALAASNRHANGSAAHDLDLFRPQRHLDGGCPANLLPFGAGERVCLGRSLAELEIRLLAVGLLQRLRLELVPGQNPDLQMFPSPTPKAGLLVRLRA